MPMRVVTYESERGTAGRTAARRLGRRRLGRARRRRRERPRAARRRPARRARGGRRSGDAAAPRSELLPPVPDPEKIICIGLNYSAHAAEARHRARRRARRSSPSSATRCAPDGDRGRCRRRATRSTTRRRSRSWSAAARRTSPRPTRSTTSPATRCSTTSPPATSSSRRPQWMPGKVFDGSAPCGPAIVTPDEAGPHDAIGIALDLNGERMQEATTAGPDLLDPAARRPPLEPDDARAGRHRLDRDPGGRRRRPRPERLAEAGRRGRDQLAAARASCGRGSR